MMDLYKIHRRQLYKLNRSGITLEEGAQHTSLVDQWDKIEDNISINFYDFLEDRKGDQYSVEFKFTFRRGKIDKKELISLELENTKAERESIDKMWDIEQKIFDDFRSTSLKYRFFSWLEGRLNKMTNWARKKHRLPIELRKMAYQKSGRLEKDPKSLDIYMDV